VWTVTDNGQQPRLCQHLCWRHADAHSADTDTAAHSATEASTAQLLEEVERSAGPERLHWRRRRRLPEDLHSA